MSQSVYKNNNRFPVTLILDPFGRRTIAPGASFIGEDSVFKRYKMLTRVEAKPAPKAVAAPVKVQEPPKVEPKVEQPVTEQPKPETIKKFEGTPEEMLTAKGIWDPAVRYVDFNKMDIRSMTRGELAFILDTFGLKYEEKDRKWDLAKLVKTVQGAQEKIEVKPQVVSENS